MYAVACGSMVAAPAFSDSVLAAQGLQGFRATALSTAAASGRFQHWSLALLHLGLCETGTNTLWHM